jgi:mucin-19
LNSKFHRFLLALALFLGAGRQSIAQPLITLQPLDVLNLVLGNTANFQVSATSTATANLQYQWLRNGVRIPGATNNILTITDAKATDGGAFTVMVNDGVGVTESSTANLTLDILELLGDTVLDLLGITSGDIRGSNLGDTSQTGEPEIIPGDPGGSEVWYSWTPLLGGVATFSTLGSGFDTLLGVYTGSAPDNLTPVPSAINSDDGGGYLCSQISFNASGLTTYLIAVDGYYGAQGNIVLTWSMKLGDSLPSASAIPPAVTTSSTGTVQLSNPWGKNCDWLFNSVPIATNTNSLIITNVNDATVGSYTARYTSSGGSVAYSRPTSVQANTLQDGSTATNAVAWNKFLDSANVPFAPTPPMQGMAGGGDTRGYSVSQTFSTQGNSDEPGEPIVCNQNGGSPAWFSYVTPVSGSLLINTAESTFNTILGVYTGLPNSFATLTNIGCGYTTNYLSDGQPSVLIPNVSTDQTNYIVVEGENGASGTVHLNINLGSPVSINTPPASQSAGPGTNVSLSVTVNGSTPISYFWQFNGTNIPAATNATITISNLGPSQGGSYTVVVSNVFAVVSTQAIVSVIQPPSIVNQPSNQVVCFGSTAILNCAASGGEPLAYQWQVNGASCLSATNSSFTIANVQMSNTGSYSCLVTNVAGVAASSTAMLVVSQSVPSVTWPNPAQITYGTALASAQLGATANVPGTFTYAPGAGTVVNAGTQTLSVVFTPSDTMDYSAVTNTVSMVVSPAPLTITANNRTKVYGQAITFSGTEFTAAGLVNGDIANNVTLTSSGATAAASVGGSPYIIVPTAAVGSGLANYVITYVPGALAVSPAALSVTANNRAKVYGQTATFSGTEFTTGGLANGDTVTSVTLSSAGAVASSAIGGSAYAIVPSAASGSGLANYTISYVNGLLTISPAGLTVTANNRAKTYGQTVVFAGTEFVAAGLLNGDTVASVTLTSSGSPASAVVAGSPYNIVPSVATGSGLANYTISYNSGTLTVSPAPLSITANNQSKTYGQSIAFGETAFAAIGLLNNDSVNGVTLTSVGAGAAATVSGSPYSVSVSVATGSGLGNYSIVYVNASLTVNPAGLTITANNRSKTYGQTVSFAGTEFAAAGLQNGDAVASVTLACSGAAGSATVASSPYSIVPSGAVGSGLGNYTIAYANGTLTVNPAALTVTANNRSKTYGQSVTFAGTEFATAGLQNGDTVTSVTFACSGGAGSATVAGSPYSIVPSAASGSGLGNYTIAYANGTLTVNPAGLTITANNRSKTYGQTVIFAGTEFSAAGLQNGDTVTGMALACSGAAGSATVAGSPYSIAPSAAAGSGLGNYVISYANGGLAVTAAALTITANNRTKTYGQIVTFVGTEFTDTGLVNSDAVASVTLASAGAAAMATVAGSPYPIAPSAAIGAGLANYAISYLSGVLTVTDSGVIITWSSPAPTTYGSALGAKQLNATANVPGSFIYIPSNNTVLNAGTNTLSAVFTPADTTDYNGQTDTVSLVVLPATLTVTAASTNRAYGQINPSFSGTITGVTNGDNITAYYSTIAIGGSPLGSYPIVPSLADPNERQSNYIVTLVDGALTVLQGAPVVAWSNSPPITYGAALTSNQLNAAVNVPGSFTYSPTNGAVLNAGSNTLSVVFRPADTVDYASVTNLVNLLVSPAPLTVTAISYSRPFAAANPVFTGTITGVTNGDEITATYSCAAVASSPQGSYPIAPNLLDPNDRQTNYMVTLVDGLLVVGHPAETFMWTNPVPIVYGTPLTGVQLNAAANVPGTYSYVPTNGSVLSTGTNILSVIFTPDDSVNYNSVTDTVNLVVTPTPLIITAGSTNRIYGQNNPVFMGIIVGAINRDDITATISCNATMASPVGTYVIDAVAAIGTDLTNYAITYVNGTLTINPAVLTIAANNRTKAYGQSVTFAGTEFGVAGLLNGDSVTGVTLTSPGAGQSASVAGSPYSVVPGAAVGSGLGNYTITYTDGAMNVTPAALIITANSRAKTYGQGVTFAGTEFAANGLLNGDTVNSVTLTSLGAAAIAPVAGSPYRIIPSAAVGSGLANYTVTYTDGTLSISPAELTVTGNSRAKTYGQTVTFAGTEFAVAGLVNSDTVNSVTLTSFGAPAAATVSASPYPIIPGAAQGVGLANYSITYANGGLTVNPAALTITADSQTKTFGQTLTFVGTEFTAAGLLNEDTVAGVSLTSPGVTVTATVAGSPYPIIPGAAQGSGLANYAISYADGILVVNQSTVLLTWTNPSPITYGAAVTTNQLNAAANVPGAFNYFPTNETVLDAGTNALTVIFTPADTADYISTTDTVSLVVLPAPLSVTASSFARPFGDANPVFTGTITGVTNGDDITSSYTCAATPTSPVGIYPITPSLSDPDNRLTNYMVTAVGNNLTITQATPIISWNAPAPIICGAAITPSQLNATANVPGSFAYSPPSGSVLNPGTNALSVVFTPGDGSNYASVTNTVGIIVMPSQPQLQVSAQGGLLVLSWPTSAANATILMTTDLTGDWVPISGGVIVGDQITLSTNMTGVCAFFRLKM